jgi:hypothetical protein
VIAGKDDDLRIVQPWPRIATPTSIPDHQLLQPPERGRWLGQLGIPVARRIKRTLIRSGKLGQRGAEIG